MRTEKVALTREKETLLITLWAKASESRLPDSCSRTASRRALLTGSTMISPG